MRKLLAVVAIAALAWGGYWFVGSSAVERALAAWLDARRADGWVADYSSLNTSGFPSRFDTTITDLNLSDPRSGLGWSAPIFQILSLSYKPHHIIVALAHNQRITTPVEQIEITSDQMRGSVVFEPSTALPVDHSAFVMHNVALSASTGWTSRLDEGRFATRKAVAQENTYDIAFSALGFAPTNATRRTLDPAGRLPDAVETLNIDTTVAFDAPWDRFAIEGQHPRITDLKLNALHATWGDLDLKAAGELSVDAQGIPTGNITVTATNWREMLKMAVAGGALSTSLAPTLEKGLEVLAGLSGDPGTLDIPLRFQDGMVSVGPVPLGPAPRLP